MTEPIKSPPPRKVVFLRLPHDLVAQADQAAANAGVSRNALVERVLRKSSVLRKAA